MGLFCCGCFAALSANAVWVASWVWLRAGPPGAAGLHGKDGADGLPGQQVCLPFITSAAEYHSACSAGY